MEVSCPLQISIKRTSWPDCARSEAKRLIIVPEPIIVVCMLFSFGHLATRFAIHMVSGG